MFLKQDKKSLDYLEYDFYSKDKMNKYFEGWYIKFSLYDNKNVVIIPSLHWDNGKAYGNIQWIVRHKDKFLSGNQSFSETETKFETTPFTLTLGNNLISERTIDINLDKFTLKADIIKTTPFDGNIMGPFRVFKNLPCIHGVQAVSGYADIKVQSNLLNLEERAMLYCEKDRGITFPEKYIWFQTVFNENSSIFFSIALIPLGPIKFIGYIAYLVHDGITYSFATYRKSKCKVLKTDEDNFKVLLNSNDTSLEIEINKKNSVELDSPRDGLMQDKVYESLNSHIKVIVKDSKIKDSSIKILESDDCCLEISSWF